MQAISNVHTGHIWLMGHIFPTLALKQGCATSGPQSTTWPAKPFSVALANTLIFPIMHENCVGHKQEKIDVKLI